MLNANPPRVKAVLNLVATADWVVAFFPKFFELTRLQDLGSAGHDGFALTQSTPNVHQITYVEGSHSAAIEEPVWDVIADFVLTGNAEATNISAICNNQNACVKSFGSFPPIVWAIIAGLVYAVWKGIEWLICATGADPVSQAFIEGVALTVYVLLLWLVVTRV
ncbi:MAG: hypothetical protein B0W54_18530 [Cellvibrio sp. 79]|nr:MAG: hypothetical protein B0W54_18530 [Cellvibrio sp. 79]